LREKCRLRVFENIVLRRIFRPERDEVTGEWRKLHNKKLYALYSPPWTLGMDWIELLRIGTGGRLLCIR
jgi:hypothetical protein